MTRAWPFEAVRQFVLKAADGHTNAELAEIVSNELGIVIGGDAISRWRTGETRDVPAPHLFAIARRLHISIDKFAIEETLLSRMLALEERVEEHRRYMVLGFEEINRLRADRGERPIEFPGSEAKA